MTHKVATGKGHGESRGWPQTPRSKRWGFLSWLQGLASRMYNQMDRGKCDMNADEARKQAQIAKTAEISRWIAEEEAGLSNLIMNAELQVQRGSVAGALEVWSLIEIPKKYLPPEANQTNYETYLPEFAKQFIRHFTQQGFKMVYCETATPTGDLCVSFNIVWS